MSFLELIKKRYSVRSYKPDPVEKEKLEMILEAARLAPTAANRQPISFIVVRTEGRKNELSRIYGRAFYGGAAGNLRLLYPGTGLDEERRQVLWGSGRHHCHGPPDPGSNRAGPRNLLDCRFRSHSCPGGPGPAG